MVAGLIFQLRVAGAAGTGMMIETGTVTVTGTDSGTGMTTREGKTR